MRTEEGASCVSVSSVALDGLDFVGLPISAARCLPWSAMSTCDCGCILPPPFLVNGFTLSWIVEGGASHASVLY